MSETAIVILNWNGKHFLKKFLPGVVEKTADTEIIVADNNSTDGSLSWLNEYYPTVRIISFETNHGFAGGYQRALNQVDATFYVLLNSDVEVTDNWLMPLLDMFRKDPKLAAVQPKIMSYTEKNIFEYSGAAGGFLDAFGYPFCRGRIFGDVEKDEGQYDNEKEIFWATGACLMVRSHFYHEAGGLDEMFFAHMEEIDLCWRLKRLGYSIKFCPASTVYHLGGGTLPPNTPFKIFLNFRNSLYLLHKNLSKSERNKILFIRKILDFIAALRFLSSFEFKLFFAVFKGHLDYYRNRKNLAVNSLKGKNHISGIYPHSIVFSYFFRGRRRFTDLNWD